MAVIPVLAPSKGGHTTHNIETRSGGKPRYLRDYDDKNSTWRSHQNKKADTINHRVRPNKKPADITEDALRALIKPFIGYFSYNVKQKFEICRK